jgi:predicted TPR repeat methyltransferase
MRLNVWELHRKIALRSYDPGAYEQLCRILCNMDERDYAEGIFQRWLQVDPGNARAQHLRAALIGKDVPERCSQHYLMSEFDSFSHSFDEVLKGLDYRAPRLVADALLEEHPSLDKILDVLDAGCGTGLCGPLLRSHARRLVGVDIAGGMLNKADERQLYDELVQSEITSFMMERPSEFDVVVSSDVLVYFGILESVFRAFARTMRPGGLLLLTVERLDDDDTDFRLNKTGRYSHSASYLRRVCNSAGLLLQSITGHVLRFEDGTPVRGLLVRARCAQEP